MKKILQHITLILLMLIGIQSFAQNTEKDYVSFGGHVFAEFFPIENGITILFDEQNTPIDTAVIDTLGYYYFYKKPTGVYYLMSYLRRPDPNFGDFSTTYYPNTVDSEKAEAIEIYTNNWELDIRLVNHNNSPEGDGSFKGTIIVEDNSCSAYGIDIQLHDNEGFPIRRDLTNEAGSFEIPNLGIGTYTLKPQILGFQTIPHQFEITESNLNHENVVMTIKNGQISSYINEAIVADHSFSCFPNPANHTLNISFEFDGTNPIQTRVVDITGRTILELQDFSSNQYSEQINTSNWDNGYYFVEVFINGTKAVSQKVAVLH